MVVGWIPDRNITLLRTVPLALWPRVAVLLTFMHLTL